MTSSTPCSKRPRSLVNSSSGAALQCSCATCLGKSPPCSRLGALLARQLHIVGSYRKRTIGHSREGEEGDNFYVVESGEYVAVKGDVEVSHYHGRGAFGELALMYHCPRAATVQASRRADNDSPIQPRMAMAFQACVGAVQDALCPSPDRPEAEVAELRQAEPSTSERRWK